MSHTGGCSITVQWCLTTCSGLLHGPQLLCSRLLFLDLVPNQLALVLGFPALACTSNQPAFSPAFFYTRSQLVEGAAHSWPCFYPLPGWIKRSCTALAQPYQRSWEHRLDHAISLQLLAPTEEVLQSRSLNLFSTFCLKNTALCLLSLGNLATEWGHMDTSHLFPHSACSPQFAPGRTIPKPC